MHIVYVPFCILIYLNVPHCGLSRPVYYKFSSNANLIGSDNTDGYDGFEENRNSILFAHDKELDTRKVFNSAQKPKVIVDRNNYDGFEENNDKIRGEIIPEDGKRVATLEEYSIGQKPKIIAKGYVHEDNINGFEENVNKDTYNIMLDNAEKIGTTKGNIAFKKPHSINCDKHFYSYNEDYFDPTSGEYRNNILLNDEENVTPMKKIEKPLFIAENNYRDIGDKIKDFEGKNQHVRQIISAENDVQNNAVDMKAGYKPGCVEVEVINEHKTTHKTEVLADDYFQDDDCIINNTTVGSLSTLTVSETANDISTITQTSLTNDDNITDIKSIVPVLNFTTTVTVGNYTSNVSKTNTTPSYVMITSISQNETSNTGSSNIVNVTTSLGITILPSFGMNSTLMENNFLNRTDSTELCLETTTMISEKLSSSIAVSNVTNFDVTVFPIITTNNTLTENNLVSTTVTEKSTEYISKSTELCLESATIISETLLPSISAYSGNVTIFNVTTLPSITTNATLTENYVMSTIVTENNPISGIDNTSKSTELCLEPTTQISSMTSTYSTIEATTNEFDNSTVMNFPTLNINTIPFVMSTESNQTVINNSEGSEMMLNKTSTETQLISTVIYNVTTLTQIPSTTVLSHPTTLEMSTTLNTTDTTTSSSNTLQSFITLNNITENPSSINTESTDVLSTSKFKFTLPNFFNKGTSSSQLETYQSNCETIIFKLSHTTCYEEIHKICRPAVGKKTYPTVVDPNDNTTSEPDQSYPTFIFKKATAKGNKFYPHRRKGGDAGNNYYKKRPVNMNKYPNNNNKLCLPSTKSCYEKKITQKPFIPKNIVTITTTPSDCDSDEELKIILDNEPSTSVSSRIDLNFSREEPGNCSDIIALMNFTHLNNSG